MPGQLSIRKRIFTGLLSLGLLSSFCFAIAIKFSADYLEDQILQSTFADELEVIQQTQENGDAWLPQSTHTFGFLASRDHVPDEFSIYDEGQYHEIVWGHQSYHLFVTPVGDDTLYLALQIEAIERYEERLNIVLIVVVVGLSLLSLWIAFWFTGLIARPVTELARNVESLSASDTKLPASVQDTDLAAIEKSINSYLGLIQDHLHREKLFSGMASHELRTPISTIRSSVETLIENVRPMDERQLQRAQRIQRASLEMQYITESLLSLIKQNIEDTNEVSPYDLAPLLEEIIEDHRPLVRNENVALCLKIAEPSQSTIKRSLVKILVGNLLRNSLQNTLKGEVSMTLAAASITIKDTGYGTPQDVIKWINDPDDSAHPLDKTGIGLFIVLRLCKQLNLRITATSLATGGAEFYLTWKHQSQ
jgi:signal transduction histidine kinase